MKAGSRLERQTLLKRKAPMKRTAWARRTSPKAADGARQLAEATVVVLQRSEGRCEVADCIFRVDHCHHRKMRSQGGPHTPDNLIAVCSWHHDWIHRHPADSYGLGLLIRGRAPITPFEQHPTKGETR